MKKHLFLLIAGVTFICSILYINSAKGQEAGTINHPTIIQEAGVIQSGEQDDMSMARKFWFQFGIGPGYTLISTDDFGAEFRISGVSMIAEIEPGIYINNNQVIFADIFGQTLFSPTYEYGGVEMSSSEDLSVVWSGLGLGFGHYFEPQRIIIKGSIGIDRLSIDEDGETTAETQSGIYGKLAVGKEWLVSKKLLWEFLPMDI
uniref:hypothetical protein n=1 Tax=uncultured Draconibacterium sp. TaxID=1573823 RepID=UPI003216ECF8